MSDFESRARRAADAVRRQVAENTAPPELGIRRAQRSPGRVALPAAAAVIVLVAAFIGFPYGGGNVVGGSGTAYALPGPLKPFDTCDAVSKYFQDQAPAYLIERAGHGVVMAEDGGSNTGGAPVQSRDNAGAGDEAGSAQDYSTTNVQEAGIDEPDLVKTDGQRIVAVARGRVHLIGVVDGKMKLRATLRETDARNVFLAGDRLLVFSGGGGGQPGIPGPAESGRPWTGRRAVIAMYDISALRQPQPIATLTIDGDVLDARLVGTQVRIATTSSPDVDAPSPVYDQDGQISDRSKEELRKAVSRTDVDDWIPAYTLRDGAGEVVQAGRLVECTDLARPEKFSGLDTVAVSSVDMTSALQSRKTVGVIAGGQQLYASGTSIYIATTEWNRDEAVASTSLHKFVTASSGLSSYRGSGEVPGTLLNQYAMSEHKSVLRVASTVSVRRGWVNPREVVEGVVTTLGEQDGALRQLGQVGELGTEDNESIRAVRFIEERGYVVTFRQTDPLYVLDLRDPAVPRMVGELKIPGYSGYLHPIGEDLLLGVGQSGAAAGEDRPDPRGDQVGVQFSLFNVSDPERPRRIDTQTYGGGMAAAEFDPKAFLYWAPRKLIVAPTFLYGDHRGRGAFSGVVLLRATDDGLTERGRLAVPSKDGTVSRSLIIGDVVYLLSETALQAHDLKDHRRVDRLTF